MEIKKKKKKNTKVMEDNRKKSRCVALEKLYTQKWENNYLIAV